MLGIPTRIEIGPRDIENNQAIIVRRDTNEKIIVNLDEIDTKLKEILETIQKNMFVKAKKFLDSHMYQATTMEEMIKISEEKEGFIKANWCGSNECEEEIKAKTAGFGSRCIEENTHISGNCINCNKQAKHVVYWGKSY